MKEMKRFLVVLAVVLMASPVLFAASGPTTDSAVWGNGGKSSPTLDGAVWGNNSKSAPPAETEGATWGSESIDTPTQKGNGSAEGAYYQRILDLMKSLGRGLGLLVEGATWG